MQIKQRNDFETFFSEAPALHPNANKMTGVICGVRIEEIFWSLAILYLPVMTLADAAVDEMTASGLWIVTLAIVWMAMWALAALRLSRFECPDCGNSFFLGRRVMGVRIGNVWANRCRHCRSRAVAQKPL
jgi:hypothetical protein